MLRTRAPLSCHIATTLSFDLHVLGLPLAFILSQDQTLHCKKFVLTFSQSINFEVRYFFSLNFKELSFSKKDCKIKTFFVISKINFNYFFDSLNLQSHLVQNRGAKVTLIFRLPNFISSFFKIISVILSFKSYSVFQNGSAKVTLIPTYANIFWINLKIVCK